MRSLGQQTPRRDPAPSRWGYRYQRLMLTPGVRRSLRIGVPLAVLAVISAAWFSKAENRDLVATTYQDIRTSIETRPEFMVNAMAIDGASEALELEIRTVLPVDFPLSSFELDLEVMRDTVEAVGAVERATLRVKPGGILQVDVTPRVPVAVWRRNDGLDLIDAGGAIIGPLAQRADRADLPLIAGDGARQNVTEALALIDAAGPVAPRVRGLVRMGERRWDVVLDRDQRVLLPADRPLQAFERVVLMAQTQDLLDRDVLVVDMRNEDRPTIRLGEQATVEMRRLNASVSGAGN
ncbi:cell division protein FtsQ/DivIB [Marivivens marinus]|uniref:cell division protein FtsQ/DivIB n=1 Tax=Marivivens marinus TaxID=3110173 RepID=UPI003B8486F3